MPNKALQPTGHKPLRGFCPSAELGRWASMKAMLSTCGALLLLACVASPAGNGPRVDPKGYGPYRLGMTINDINALLGKPAIAYTGVIDPGACDSIWRNGDYEHPDVRFLFLGDSLELIDIWLEGALTPENVGTGSSQEAVRKKYAGRFRVDGDHYDRGTFHIFVPVQDSNSVYRFTYSASQTITEMRVATPNSVTLVEGCG